MSRRTIVVISGIAAAILAATGVEVYRHERAVAPRSADLSFGSPMNAGYQQAALGWPNCTRGTPSTSGSLRAIQVFVLYFGAGGTVNVALYSDTGAGPGNLIVQSSPGLYVASQDIYTLDVPSTPIVGGTSYWLCAIQSDGNLGVFTNPVPGQGAAQAAPGFQNPLQVTAFPTGNEYFITGIYNELVPQGGERQVVVGGGIL